MIPVANFKSNKLSHLDKKHRAEEVQKMLASGIDDPGSPTKFDAIRMPNKVTKQSKEVGQSTVCIAN